MKKIIHSLFLINLIIFVYSCAGYEAIYKQNIKFEIAEYSLMGDKNLANRIYFNLKNLSKTKQNEPDARSIDIFIKVLKTKKSTIKNSSGKVLEYKINLNTLIIVKDFLTEKTYPLTVVFCQQCKEIQILETISSSTLFEDYRFVSSTTTTLSNHFVQYAKAMKERFLNKDI